MKNALLLRWVYAGLVILAVSQVALAADKLIVDYDRDNMTLNGTWRVLVGHVDEPLWETQTLQKLEGWKDTTLPGKLNSGPGDGATREQRDAYNEKVKKIRGVWVHRTFQLDERQASRNAVLKWGAIRFGASAWVNGQKVTTHPTVGPHTVLLPEELLRAGGNTILLQVSGWSGIPKSESDKPLTPTGGSVESWGSKRPSFLDDIYLEFYDRAYLKWILAIPDPEAEKVTFRVWVDSAGDLPRSLDVRIAVTPVAKREELSGVAEATVQSFDKPTDIGVDVKNPKLWTPQTPNLYAAQVVAKADGKTCDKVEFRFGIRDIRVIDGHYRLNGKPLWLRGSNLVNEWNWGDRFNNNVKRYIVDEARVMNLNVFRTHTLPPPASWANVADEHGTMIMAEMPVLYNYASYKFTPEEWEVWHENVLIDAPGWITKLWNHPSVIMWVISNETVDNEWERGPYRDAVVALDPTRPTMRTGDHSEIPGTKENLDLHPCTNIAKGPEGWVIQEILNQAAQKDPTRTLTNTEYMNGSGGQEHQQLLWMGRTGDPEWRTVWADAAAEHTEVMRRVQLDGILPYMYAGWTGMRGNTWRDGFPTPMAAALHSSMSPVLASLDLFDRNYIPGQEVATPLHLINELSSDVDAKIDVYITPQNPLVIPDDDALKAAIWQESFKRTFKADTIGVEQLKWKAPDEPGIYYLAVVVNRPDARPVVSQRMIRSIPQADDTAQLAGKKIIVLGADEVIESWLKANHVNYATTLKGKKIKADVVLLWDLAAVKKETLAKAGVIRKYVQGGGRVLILHQPPWTWKEIDEDLKSLLNTNSINYAETVTGQNMRADIALTCKLSAINKKNPAQTDAIRKCIQDGGRVLIINEGEWTWKKLLDFEIVRKTDWISGRSSRVFPYRYVTHPMLSGVDPEWLKRWNSMPGLVSDGWLAGKALETGAKILWQEKPARPVVLAVPLGQGEMVVSLLHLKQRINADSVQYDPAAERVFMNLLAPPTRPPQKD